MIKQNQWLMIGTGVIVTLWVLGHLFFVQDNWHSVEAGITDARGRKESLDKFFKKDGRIPKTQAQKMLDESNSDLQKKLGELKNIEFGNRQSLSSYTEAAAKNGDVKTYLDTKRIQLNSKARATLAVTATDLGIADRTDDPIGLNLMRIAFVESFLTSCKEAGVITVNKIQHGKPAIVALPTDDQPQPSDTPAEKPPEKPAIERLIQYPMRVMFTGPEKSVERLLLELQQSTDPTRGYFALRGFQVMVKDLKDTSSGTVEAAISVAALLSESEAQALGLALKTARPESEQPGGLNRY